jgi:hypothetical protein
MAGVMALHYVKNRKTIRLLEQARLPGGPFSEFYNINIFLFKYVSIHAIINPYWVISRKSIEMKSDSLVLLAGLKTDLL